MAGHADVRTQLAHPAARLWLHGSSPEPRPSPHRPLHRAAGSRGRRCRGGPCESGGWLRDGPGDVLTGARARVPAAGLLLRILRLLRRLPRRLRRGAALLQRGQHRLRTLAARARNRLGRARAVGRWPAPCTAAAARAAPGRGQDPGRRGDRAARPGDRPATRRERHPAVAALQPQGAPTSSRASRTSAGRTG